MQLFSPHSCPLLVAAAGDGKPPGWPEKIVACLGVALFSLIGLGLLRAACGEFTRVNRCRRRLVRLPGRVVNVVSQRQYQAGTNTESRYDTGYVLKFFPEISFTKPNGQQSHFRSELGESHRVRRDFDGSNVHLESSWRTGQQVEVYFDPEGEMKPCLASPWSLWFMPTGMLVAGILFLGAGTFMFLMARAKVFV